MQIIDRVSPAEMEQIRDLHARKAALKELVFSMSAMKPEELGHIYERVVLDLAQTVRAFDEWWADHQTAGGWPREKLEIDFKTCEIFLRG